MKNILIAAAIVAVASVNVYIMNDVDLNSNNDLSLLTLENVADAGEIIGRSSEEVGKAGQEKEVQITCEECKYKAIVCDKGQSNCTPKVCEHLYAKANKDGYGMVKM